MRPNFDACVKCFLVCLYTRTAYEVKWPNEATGRWKRKWKSDRGLQRCRDAANIYKDMLCLFFLVCFGCDTSYIVSVLNIYNRVAFISGAASQAGDADSSRAPGLTSGLQGSVNIHRGALLLVSQWQCISSFVFYILLTEESFYFNHVHKLIADE